MVIEMQYNIVQDLEGDTALHIAVREGVELPVKVLIDAGADSTRVNHKLESPVLLAAQLGLAGYVNSPCFKYC